MRTLIHALALLVALAPIPALAQPPARVRPAAPDEAAHPSPPLTERGLANLTAFAQMFGQVKYFHPSEAAFKADWTALAFDGVERSEPCADPAALAAALRAAFAPVGVGIQVWVESEPAPPLPPAAEQAEDARITGWVHDGVSFGPEFASAKGRNVYKSQRVKESAAAPPAAEGKSRKLPEPGTCVTDGHAGVRWRIPVVLTLDSRGFTAGPDTESPAQPAARHAADVTGNDRTTRLAAVVIAWNLFDHFYPYFDVVKTDWPATLARSLNRAASDADEIAFLRTLRMLVADLKDGHGSVNNAALQAPDGMPCGWRFVGAEGLIITSGGNEEREDGLRPGDRILSVDGENPAALLADWRTMTSSGTEGWTRYASARSMLTTAPAGNPSTVKVDRKGEQVTVTVPLVPLAQLRQSDPRRPDAGAVVGRIEGREGPSAEVLYFNLSGAKHTSFKEIAQKLAGAGGIVFDLRGYPDSAATVVLSHLTSEPIRSAKWVIPSITMPGGINGGGWKWVESSGRWTLTPLEPRLGGPAQPIAFLTDGRAISYAESIMGIVEAYKLGEIVGSTTAGCNGNVNPFTLPGGYSVSWTGMRVIKHDDSTHHGVGIAPTVPCEPTRAGIAAGKDEVLERAVQVIQSKARSRT